MLTQSNVFKNQGLFSNLSGKNKNHNEYVSTLYAYMVLCTVEHLLYIALPHFLLLCI